MKIRLDNKKIAHVALFAYLVSLSSFQLGYGFDAWFARLSFIALAVAVIFMKKIIVTTQAKWCLLFWFFYFMSMIWAKNPNDTLYYVNNFIQIIGLSIMLPSIIENKKDINKIIKIIILSLLVAVVIIILRSPNLLSDTDRLGEVIGLHPNALGMRLSIAGLFSLYFIKNNTSVFRRKYKKIVPYILLFFIFGIMLILTGSKKSLFILIGGFLLFEIVHRKGALFLPKILLGALFLIGITYFIYNNEVAYQIMGKRIEYTMNTVLGTTTSHRVDTSLLERQFYADRAAGLFMANPLIGYGGNNFVTYMEEISYSHVAYSHNNYLELLSTLGIFGFIIYYSFWLFTFFRTVRVYLIKRDHLSTLSMISILLLLITDFGNVSYISEFNFIVFILINIYLNLSERNIDGLVAKKVNGFGKN